MKYTVHNTMINVISLLENFNPLTILWYSNIPRSDYYNTQANPNFNNLNSWACSWNPSKNEISHWVKNQNLDIPFFSLFKDKPNIRFKVSNHSKNIDLYTKHINDLQISTSRIRDEIMVDMIHYLNRTQIDHYNILDVFTSNEIFEINDTVCYTNSKAKLIDHFDFFDITDLLQEKLDSKDLFDLEDSIFRSNNFIYSFSERLTSQINYILENSSTTDKIKMYDIKKLCRGSGPPEMEAKEKSLKAISKGYKILPLKYRFKEVNPKTEEERNSVVYFFFTNFNHSLTRKYRKANRFMTMLENYSKCNEGAWFYDMDLFEKLEEKKFGKNVIYWDKMSSIFKNSSQSYNKIVAHSQVQETEFDPKLYSFYSKIKKTRDNTHYTSYTKTVNRLNEISAKITSLENSSSSIISRKSRAERAIETTKRELERYISDLKKIEKEKQEIDTNLPSYIEIKKSLTPKIKTLKENYKNYLKEFSETILSDETEDKYRLNFEKKGIVIDSVKYKDSTTGNIFSLKDSKTLLSSIDPDSNLKIHSVDFRITKPVIIYVDRMEKGENCKKVVGGPYIISVTEGNLDIGLLSSASVFGHHTSNNGRASIFVHPHSGQMGVNTSNPENFWSYILNSKSRACLGEASQAVHAAFKAKDIRQIILACMAWVTSANSSDTWGKNYKYFPKPEDIKESKNNVNITKEYIKSQVFEDQIKEKESMLDLLYDTVPEESINDDNETTNSNQENNEIPTQIQESIERLRRAGHPNYQPLYRSSNET